jgi:pimeloyl-ACP methyl ester carboxylesterase
METRAYETPLGTIWLRGETQAFDGDQPLVFGLAGAFARPEGMPSPLHLGPHLAPDFAMVGGHLPGNHCPPLVVASIGAYAAAYSQALDQAFPRRRIVALSASVGGLVTMGLRSPQVESALVVEPPLVMDKLWPMRDFLRRRFDEAAADDPLREFITNVFGVTEAGVAPRDYRSLLESLAFPITVLVGARPLLPERPIDKMPSLVDEPERALMAGNPKVSLHEAPGAGHNLLEQAAPVASQHFESLLRAIAPGFSLA